MSLTTEFVPLELNQLRREAAVLKADAWRFIQTHAVYTDNGVDLYYSFMKDGRIRSYRIAGVQKDQAVPSITDMFLAAFVFENEARELFGVDMRDIAIDFGGAMYAPAVAEPMTIISPEQKAAREKARKAAEKKAAAPEGEGAGSAPAAGAPGRRRIFVMTPERQARLDAVMPTLSPEKRAKVEAALKARAAEAEAAASGAVSAGGPAAAPEKPKAQPEAKGAEPAPDFAETKGRDAVLEQKIAGLAPEKAAKVRAALAGAEAVAEDAAGEVAAGTSSADEQLARLIANMDETKAATVRAALNLKGGE